MRAMVGLFHFEAGLESSDFLEQKLLSATGTYVYHYLDPWLLIKWYYRPSNPLVYVSICYLNKTSSPYVVYALSLFSAH